jgi:hypothetical protein
MVSQPRRPQLIRYIMFKKLTQFPSSGRQKWCLLWRAQQVNLVLIIKRWPELATIYRTIWGPFIDIQLTQTSCTKADMWRAMSLLWHHTEGRILGAGLCLNHWECRSMVRWIGIAQIVRLLDESYGVRVFYVNPYKRKPIILIMLNYFLSM